MAQVSFIERLRIKFKAALGTSGRSKAHRGAVLLALILIVLVAIPWCSPASFSLEGSSSVDGRETSSSKGGEGEDATSPQEEESGSFQAGDAQDESKPSIFVHVAGCVVQPGLVEMTEGSRVADAIAAAGGFSENAALDAVNLAALLQDGEQIIVPSRESFESSPGGGANQTVQSGGVKSTSSQGKVNINRASMEELMTLKGVGEATAQKIVEDRRVNGPFKSVDDLKRVSGIGAKKLAALRDYISI